MLEVRLAILAASALLSAEFEDVPSRNDLSSPNGHNAGLSALRKDGKWGLAGTIETMRHASMYGFGGGSTKGLAVAALAAMGVPLSPEAVTRLYSVLDWRPPSRPSRRPPSPRKVRCE